MHLITLDSISKHDFVMRVTGKKLEKREMRSHNKVRLSARTFRRK